MKTRIYPLTAEVAPPLVPLKHFHVGEALYLSIVATSSAYGAVLLGKSSSPLGVPFPVAAAVLAPSETPALC
jgi:hypothetical protein